MLDLLYWIGGNVMHAILVLPVIAVLSITVLYIICAAIQALFRGGRGAV